jgi:hypothetical protein
MLYRGSVTKGLVRASMHPQRGSQLSLSLRTWVFHPNTCRYVRLLGPCFKTGRLKPLCQHPKHEHGRNLALRHAEFLNPNRCMHHQAITHPRMPHSQQLYPTVKIDADPSTRKYTQQKQGWFQVNATDFKRFPFSNFTYCLTLFPKFFSSFPHGTCSLSVSRQYLALDGIYHPFWAAFPNNSTLWEHTTKALVVHVKDGILTLCDAPFQETCTWSSTGNTSLDYNSNGQWPPDFKFELFPLHSQLLRESLLVSFPPLIDMLKFSG